MRKLILILAVFLSAVGFTTHAQDGTVTLPTETGEDNAVEVVFQTYRTNTNADNKHYYLGAIHLSEFAFATIDANEHIVWSVEFSGTPGQYYIKNKGLSYDDGTNVYLGLSGGKAAVTTTQTAFIIADSPNSECTGCVYIQPQSWDNNGDTDNALNVNGGFNYATNRPRIELSGWSKNDTGDAWYMLPAESEEVLAIRKADLASFCDNTTTLINEFQKVDGLISTEKTSDVTTILTTLSDTKAAVEADDSPTGQELEDAFHAAHQAKIEFYTCIDPNTNISLKAVDGNYLYNHLSDKGDGTTPQPHSHVSDVIGFAAIWHLVNNTTDNYTNSGIHLNSYYRSKTANNIGPGPAGNGMGNSGWTPSWFTLNTGESGILWTNNNGYQYLNTDDTKATTDVTTVNRDINTGSLWIIDRVYVPETITIVEAPAEDTPATTAEGDTEADNSITIVKDGRKVKLVPQFVSDGGEDHPVTPGLTGVDWTSSNTTTATIEGIDALGSAYPGDKHNELNGYAAGEVTPVAVGNTTITATSPMYKNPDDDRVNPSGTVELTVEEPVFEAADEVKMGDETLTATDGVYNLDYSAEERTLTVALTENTYALAFTPEDAIKIVDGENGDQSLNFTIAKGETGEKTFTVTGKYLAEDAEPLYTLKVNIAKAPLEELIVTLSETELTYSAEAQELTVTITPDPATYDLSEGTLTATIAAAQTDDNGTSTQADDAVEIELTKSDEEDNNTWIGTYTVAAGTAAGSYTITFSYTEGEESDNFTPVKATANLSIEKVSYAVTFNPTSIAPTTITESTEVAVTVAQAAATEGGDATPYTGTCTAALSVKGENGEFTQATETATVADGNVTIPALAAGDYKLTISPAEADADNVEFTGAELTFTVAQTSYTVEFSGDGVEGTSMTTAPGNATVTVAIKNGNDAVEPAPAVTASLKKEGADDATDLTISEGSIDLTGLEEGTYTLTIAAGADAKYELTGNVLTITVTAKPVYTLTVKNGETAVGTTLEVTEGEAVTLTPSFANGNETVEPAPADWTATIIAANAEAGTEATDVKSDGSIVIPASLAAGSYTLTIAAPAEGDYTFNTKTVTVTVAAATVAIEGIAITTAEADLAVEVAADATTATVAIAGKVTPEGATIPEDAKVTFAATCETTGVSATIDEATIASDGTFTATANVTVPETLAEAATINVTATYTDGITATFAITVTKATAPVAEPASITGISDLSAKTAAVKEGETSAEAEISGKVTLDPEDGAVPTDAALTLAATTTAEGVESVEISDVKIAADGTFTATATVTLADGTTIPEKGIEAEVTVTPTVGEGDDAQTLDPATVTITISNATEGSSEDLEVKQPEESEIPAGAVVEVNAESKTAEVGFNASPAEGEAVASIKLPTADEAVTFENPEEMFTIDYSAEGVATATIDEKGNVTISLTDGAAIGSATVISIYAAEPKADAPATQSAIMLADETDEPGEADETEDAPAAILTINVTVYGVEFTTAPATATLGANGSVEVTFATNAKVPGATADSEETEEGSEATNAAEVTLECEGAEVNGNVITFTQAGTYTVTAKAGNDYVATTTITVKNAPTVTGIEAVNADAAAGTAAIYDLQGRRLTRVNAAGIYIVNGVKTLVR